MGRACLRAGANPNAVDNWGQTILQWAVQDGTMESVRALLEFKYSLQWKNTAQVDNTGGDVDSYYLKAQIKTQTFIPLDVVASFKLLL